FREAGCQDRLLNETLRYFQAGIEEQGGNDRLQSIHQQSNLAAAAAPLLTPPQAKVLSKFQFPRRTKQVAGADQVRAQLGELSFLIFGKALEKLPAHHKTQHRVAQKFHLLVIGCRSRSPPGRVLRFLLAGIGSVSEGLLQESAASEAVSESFLQRGKVKRVRVHVRSMA